MSGETQQHDLEDMRDPATGILMPRNVEQWNRIRASIGWAQLPEPVIVWSSQEASDNLSDELAAFTGVRRGR